VHFGAKPPQPQPRSTGCPATLTHSLKNMLPTSHTIIACKRIVSLTLVSYVCTGCSCGRSTKDQTVKPIRACINPLSLRPGGYHGHSRERSRRCIGKWCNWEGHHCTNHSRVQGRWIAEQFSNEHKACYGNSLAQGDKRFLPVSQTGRYVPEDLNE
jgi:hypothetical protein